MPKPLINAAHGPHLGFTLQFSILLSSDQFVLDMAGLLPHCELPFLFRRFICAVFFPLPLLIVCFAAHAGCCWCSALLVTAATPGCYLP